jgi:hypothetical protein
MIPFKKWLDIWIADQLLAGKPADWSKRGVCIVVRGINGRPHEARCMTVPFETYYGMKSSCNIENLLDVDTYEMLTTEHAYLGVAELFRGLIAIEYNSGVHQDILRKFIECLRIMHNIEETLAPEDRIDMEMHRQGLVSKLIQFIVRGDKEAWN